MLSGPEIRRQRELGNIVIEPWDEACLNPNSYDVTLLDQLEIVRPTDHLWMGHSFEFVDVKEPPQTDFKWIPDGGIILQPGVLHLGSTKEYTESHGLVPQFNGKSSLGRFGIQVHQTAGFGDDGFCGTWTLEITVVQPVRIYAGMRIGQICWFHLDGERQAYKGKYQHQRGPTGARI